MNIKDKINKNECNACLPRIVCSVWSLIIEREILPTFCPTLALFRRIPQIFAGGGNGFHDCWCHGVTTMHTTLYTTLNTTLYTTLHITLYTPLHKTLYTTLKHFYTHLCIKLYTQLPTQLYTKLRIKLCTQL